MKKIGIASILAALEYFNITGLKKKLDRLHARIIDQAVKKHPSLCSEGRSICRHANEKARHFKAVATKSATYTVCK